MHWCLPWTEAQYLITKQHIVFDLPVTSCPTSDNIFVEIDISVVLYVNPESEYVYNLCMNISELNQMLEAAITERVRNMVRGVSSRKIQSIRGNEQALAMVNHLRQVMSNKGINIKSVIITRVKLPVDVGNSLQEKTIFQFKNTLERKKQSYELRIKNDSQALEYLKQQRLQQRQYETEQAELEQATKSKEVEKIKAVTKRSAAEAKERTVALVNQLNAETEVRYNQIIAEANLIETAIIANAKASAAKIKAEAEAYALQTTTEAQRENAEIVSQAITIEGTIEQALMKGSKKKRKHMQIMSRLSAMSGLASNNKAIIYGEQGNNLIANIETFKMVMNKA